YPILASIAPEDILGIEIMTSGEYAQRYDQNIRPEALYDPAMRRRIPVYIEITTRSGQGIIGGRITPGTAVFKAIPFTMPMAFYRPKYKAVNPASVADLRSTIFWEPNLISDKAGKASFHFYSADRPGTYTVTMQGTNLSGQFGYKQFKLKIGKPGTVTDRSN